MGRSKKNNDTRLNKTLRITGLIFVISAIFALVTILNKGVLFGKRLISINGENNQEPIHIVQVIATNNYLKNINETTDLRISIDGQDVSGGEGYELTSSDESIVVVEGDTVKAVNFGDAVITARSLEYDVEGTVTISVVVPANKLSLSAEFPEIKVGETSQISHTTSPKESTGVQVRLTYSSSDNSIATVDTSGIVTGKAPGVATITATDKITGISDTYDITITE